MRWCFGPSVIAALLLSGASDTHAAPFFGTKLTPLLSSRITPSSQQSEILVGGEEQTKRLPFLAQWASLIPRGGAGEEEADTSLGPVEAVDLYLPGLLDTVIDRKVGDVA